MHGRAAKSLAKAPSRRIFSIIRRCSASTSSCDAAFLGMPAKFGGTKVRTGKSKEAIVPWTEEQLKFVGDAHWPPGKKLAPDSEKLAFLVEGVGEDGAWAAHAAQDYPVNLCVFGRPSETNNYKGPYAGYALYTKDSKGAITHELVGDVDKLMFFLKYVFTILVVHSHANL